MIETRPQLVIDQFRLDLTSETLLPAKERIVPLEELTHLLEGEAKKHYLVAATSGSFDLIHVGHLHYIEDLVKAAGLHAKQWRKDPFVVIGINSDESTRRNREDRAKGRPVFAEKRRAEVIAGLKGVNAVFIFDDDLELATIAPDIFQVFTLSDHAPENRPEVLLMQKRGTQILTIHDDDRPDSTSAILGRIHNNHII